MSILHVVLVRWRHDPPAELPAVLDAFRTEIPGVLEVAYGPSVSPENLEAGYEWMLAVTFADAAARDRYLQHPAHAPASRLIGEGSEALAVFDLQL